MAELAKYGSTYEKESIVRSQLGNHRIVDAKVPFRFTANKDDCSKAVRKDPQNCALAKSIERFTGLKAIAIFHKIAYVPFDKKGDGNIVIERFSIDHRTSLAIAKFDQTGVFEPGEYKFNPPSKSIKLGAFSKRVKRKPEDTPKQQVKAVREVSAKRILNPKWIGVRNGRGRVSIITKAAK